MAEIRAMSEIRAITVRMGLSRKRIFVQCVGLPGSLFCTVHLPRRCILYSVLTYLGEHFVQCIDLSRKSILYSVWIYLERVFCTVCCLIWEGFVQCDSQRHTWKSILYSVRTYLCEVFVRCVDLSGGAFCTG